MAALAGLGAAVGALGRYEITKWVTGLWGNRWPFATLLINLLGSLLLGLLTGWQWGTWPTVIIGTGVLGGFTTYSTFSHELVMLVDQRRYGAALSYGLVSVGGGLLLAALGLMVGLRFVG
ncbi:fluoride efflux transporter CrcB [Levilactobacillus huananensis]|uniref:fluoride efflux transporter CrcB n=1 Tax=Levilactobacillus huananensis TaxID=2486019 RepID=UPI000F777BAC|nr:fluoride efflux transporter CrcB [Levilactobacillus huananensis]